MEPDTTSRAVLAGAAYGDDRDLAARQSLYAWQTPTYDLPGMTVEILREVDGRVADIGCGNGIYLRRLRAERPDLVTLGMDISTGIIETLERPTIVADAQAVPVRDAAVAAVLAMHMLYHLKHVERGLAEAARVLTRRGLLLASTNSTEDKVELDDVWASAAGDVMGTDSPPSRVSLSRRFPLEAAPSLMGAYFDEVLVNELQGVIAVDSPEPVIAHLASYRTWSAQSGVPFEDTLARARTLVEQRIRRDGAFRITTLSGLLVCRRPIR